MSLDIYGEAYNQGYGGCLAVVSWLVSGPVAYAAAESLRDALRTSVIEGSYRGDTWQFALESDPTGYHWKRHYLDPLTQLARNHEREVLSKAATSDEA